jgi:FlaA1/EpsC-like NDP-sugar epimerase
MLSDLLHISGQSAQLFLRRLQTYLVDVAAFSSSSWLAFELRFDGTLPAYIFHPLIIALCVWVTVKWAAFLVGKVSWRHWQYTSAPDVVRIVLASAGGSFFGGWLILTVLGPGVIPRSIFVLDWLLSCFLTVGVRLAVRVLRTARWRPVADSQRTRTLIYGAGSTGMALLRELLQNRSLRCDVIGFIDDDLQKSGCSLHGRRVLGAGETLAMWVQRKQIRRVLIATPSASGQQIVRILRLVTEAQVEYKMVPAWSDLIQGMELGRQVRDVAVEDLLGRKPVELDLERIHERVDGRVVMVTGAAGSIGSEICRQIARFGPLALIGFDQAETPLFNLEREMNLRFPGVVFHAEIGNINRPQMLDRVMQQYQPSVLYHAAAYKHVPLMEKHVFAAVETNVLGTWNVAQAAVEHGVRDFVMISTDKAVRPASIMGATKRAAEILIHALQTEGRTRFVAVRFGNVLGSNGSVVPIFKEQIARGGPVLVTHPEMRRYFMTIPEAAQLVLQAFSIGDGGELFVLDMGEPVRISDLAENLILLSGLQPDKDIKIEYSGLRPGEKLIEELNLHDERMVPTTHRKIRSFVGAHDVSMLQVNMWLQRLRQVEQAQDLGGLVLLLKELIPDYSPGRELLKNALLVPPSPTRPFRTPTGPRQAAGSVAKLASAAVSN